MRNEQKNHVEGEAYPSVLTPTVRKGGKDQTKFKGQGWFGRGVLTGRKKRKLEKKNRAVLQIHQDPSGVRRGNTNSARLHQAWVFSKDTQRASDWGRGFGYRNRIGRVGNKPQRLLKKHEYPRLRSPGALAPRLPPRRTRLGRILWWTQARSATCVSGAENLTITDSTDEP